MGAVDATEELLNKIGFSILKHTLPRTYRRFQRYDNNHINYSDFIDVMNIIAEQRSIRCAPDKRSPECVMAVVMSQMHDLAGGSDRHRAFTIIGTDGRIVKVQVCDASQRIKVFVQHPDGQIYCEDPSPSEIMMRIMEVRFLQ